MSPGDRDEPVWRRPTKSGYSLIWFMRESCRTTRTRTATPAQALKPSERDHGSSAISSGSSFPPPMTNSSIVA